MAAAPGQVTAFSITGDFTNTQYVGNYIDCTGLTFSVTVQSYGGGTTTINGSSFVNGSYSYAVSLGPFDATITVTASPAQFSSVGEQTVTFTASSDADPSTLTATKSVTVQSLSTIKNVYVFTADGRKAIWGTIEVDSPYQEVEYIEGTGTQYIDSEVPGNTSDLSINIKYELTELPASGSYKWIFGNYVNESTNVTRILLYGPSTTYVNYNHKAGSASTYSSTRYINVVYDETLTSTQYTSNGNSITLTKTAGSANDANIIIFDRGVNPSTSKGKFKLYFFKAYSGNTLIRDLVPCYRKSDNVAGMYDRVSGAFFTNAGTGEFIIPET